MMFAYNADKGKCYGVTPETNGSCEVTVADDSGKWVFYEFWCSEGYAEIELCEYVKVPEWKKYMCNSDACNTDKLGGDETTCGDYAVEQGLEYFSYMKKKDKCHTCPDSVDAGYTECIVENEYQKKTKVYQVMCSFEGYISPEYVCDSTSNSGEYAPGMKCGLTTNGNSFSVQTQAECNDFALGMEYDWYSYSEELGLCFLGQDASENLSCMYTELVEHNKWDTYAVCEAMLEPIDAELAACSGLEWCASLGASSADCFVAWSDEAESWKCDGATQTETDETFLGCVDETMAGNYRWMNFKTKNGACAVLDECEPVSTGSYWQIFLNCAAVHTERRNLKYNN